MSVTSTSIEKLKGRENYDVWKIAATSYLVIKGLWSYVETNLPLDASASERANDLKAKSEITLLLETQNYSFIAHATSAKEAWDALANSFEDSGLCRKVSLLKDLTSLKLADCESMEAYVNRMTMTGIKVKKAGLEISDEVVASLLLAGLPDEYKSLVMAVENSAKTLTTDKVKTLLLQEVKFDTSSAEHVMWAKRKFKCHRCHEFGHFIKNCPNKKHVRENVLLTSFLVHGADKNDWFIDSGGSAHMTHLKSILLNMRPSSHSEVLVANEETLKIYGVGDVEMTILNGTSKTNTTLTNVHYVPDLCTNIISVSQMDKNGNSVVFSDGVCKIFNKNNRLIATAIQSNGMYRLNCEVPHQILNANISITKHKKLPALSVQINENLWHRRLGHICDNNLKRVKDAVTGVDYCKESRNKCTICIEGKQTRSPFKDVGNRADNLLDLVHSDICGPLQSSIGGAKYFLTFVDDFSRKVFVYALKEKNQTFATFVKFKNYVEKQCSRKIKVFRSDNGGEYINNKFKSFCEEHGILHQKTAPYTPEQNGVAERINRTLIERVRCMLIDSKLKKNFWAEALSTAAYLSNRTPCRDQVITAEELWSGVKPDLTMLRVFGCRAMVHIPKEKRSKLDKKSIECIMLGYSNESKAYRLYNPTSKTIIISRDVIFIEEADDKVISKNCTNLKYVSPTVLTINDDSAVYNNKNSDGANYVELSIVNDPNAVHDDEMPAVSEEIAQPNESTAADVTVEAPNVTEVIIDSEDASVEDITVDSLSDYVDDTDDPTYTPDESIEIQQLRQSERIKRINELPSFNLCIKVITGSDPTTVVQALSSPCADDWIQAMEDEMKSLKANCTWTLTDLPHDKNPIKSKWVFKTKRNTNGEVIRYKARLVVKGFSQKYGIDYHETFSPVVKYTSIRFLLAVAAKLDLNIRQMDAVTAFLNGELKEDIYMFQPEGFTDGSNKVCKLHKSLYGLKQSSRVWNEKLNSVLKNFGLKRSDADQCIYLMIKNTKMLFVAIYVDDVLIFSNDDKLEKLLIDELCQNFKMQDLGEASSVLGIRISRDRVAGTVSIDQTHYVLEILDRFGMSDCNPISTPLDPQQKISSNMCPKTIEEKQQMSNVPFMQAIGSLLFASQISRPDICFAVNQLSRYSNNPGKAHWGAVKRIFRYLKGTTQKKLVYRNTTDDLKGYCDADWGSEIDQAKSTSGYVFTMQGAAISWASKRQSTVALSTTEAEFMAMVYAIQESVWLKRLQLELLPSSSQEMLVYCDNKSAIQLGKTNSTSARTKHINIKSHFIQEKIDRGEIKIEHIPTNKMLADILTKAATSSKQSTFAELFGLM